jgi:chromosomal replication initiation ATPase DnaA
MAAGKIAAQKGGSASREMNVSWGIAIFCQRGLTASQDALERKAEYREKGYDFNWLVDRVARLLEMNMDEVLTAGRYPQTVKARSILLYWAHRELGISTVELARRVNLSQPSVSQSIRRGEKLISENGYELLPKP